MASILPPLDPRIITPPGADEITDGVYIIGWHLGKNLEDTMKLPNTSLTPAVEIASVNSLSSLSGEGKFPVLVENIIDGVQPEGQYWHVQRKIDSDGRYTIRPFKGPDDATAFNDDNKLVVQSIFIPPEWYISRITPGVPMFSIIEPGSERVWVYPGKEKQVKLEEFVKVKEDEKVTHLLYLLKVADENRF